MISVLPPEPDSDEPDEPDEQPATAATMSAAANRPGIWTRMRAPFRGWDLLLRGRHYGLTNCHLSMGFMKRISSGHLSVMQAIDED
ncbi:hypothetical protein Pmi06nite_53170 [Planotetraspora mira]|uniref:Uncharacterized protein n=1 Tax=Planotetraspora mira TaxID=58121 RepID=A0A8J3U307_9ACTN|nr:hypothetical protein Pmi06nite_53170 [Planotetraspora mira]